LFHFEDYSQVLTIVNPAAGRGRRFARAMAAWTAAGRTTAVAETTRRGDAERLAREAADAGITHVLAAGGDGTVNEVINGLAGAARAPAVGVLPLGTANVLAREIGLPLDPAAAATVLARGCVRPVHLGLVNGRRFVMMAGVGFDARVVAGVSPEAKQRFGRLAYAATTAELWARGQPARYRLKSGGTTLEVGSVVVANGRYYAGGFVACPQADLFRPELALCLLKSSDRPQLLAAALALGVGRIAWAPGVRHDIVADFSIDGPEGEPLQADGDIVGSLPARFSVAPETVRLLTIS
jgi:YegS/Rv2252/BmrU family lipid kinase